MKIISTVHAPRDLNTLLDLDLRRVYTELGYGDSPPITWLSLEEKAAHLREVEGWLSRLWRDEAARARSEEDARLIVERFTRFMDLPSELRFKICEWGAFHQTSFISMHVERCLVGFRSIYMSPRVPRNRPISPAPRPRHRRQLSRRVRQPHSLHLQPTYLSSSPRKLRSADTLPLPHFFCLRIRYIRLLYT